jgi:hypothetical protein
MLLLDRIMCKLREVMMVCISALTTADSDPSLPCEGTDTDTDTGTAMGGLMVATALALSTPHSFKCSAFLATPARKKTSERMEGSAWSSSSAMEDSSSALSLSTMMVTPD